MLSRTLAFLVGDLCALSGWTWPLCVCVLPLFRFARALCLPITFFLIAYLSTAIALSYHHAQAVQALFETTQIGIGEVISIPKQKQFATEFDFAITQLEGHPEVKPLKVRVAWYHTHTTVKAGERWRFQLRFKKPHGFHNPGGFDYEKLLQSQHVQAKAYVKKIAVKLGQRPNLAYWRQRLSEQLSNVLGNSAFKGIILALALGNTQQITQSQWQIFRATGTNHLIAISGLHIGLVASLLMQLTAYMWRRSDKAMHRFATPFVAISIGMLAGTAYAALAGFSTSATRALWMLLVIGLMRFSHRRLRPWQALQTAMILILLFDPFATLSLSFSLSFFAVAWILFANAGYLANKALVRTQLAVTLGLIPVVLFFFGQFALYSLLANVVAIPIVSLWVVPCVLLGTVCLSISPWISKLLFGAASKALGGLWWYLVWVANLKFSVIHISLSSIWVLASLLMAIALLLSPKAFRLRSLSVIFILPIFLPTQTALKPGQVRVTAFDVGQGTAVLIDTATHHLLYDTGPKFSPDFNAGDAVIVPALRYFRIRKLDDVIISHGDNDHIGGLRSVQQHIAVKKIETSAVKKVPQASLCLAGQHWTYDGVHFEFIYPDKRHLGFNNNSSCVLLITAKQQHILLTGDIEALAEASIAKQTLPKVDVLLAPHHGSKTSSTQRFLNQIKPKLVIISLGYANRFHFPHRSVLARYEAMGMTILRTDQHGAIQLSLAGKGPIRWVFSRQ